MNNDVTWESVPLTHVFVYERGKEKNMASLVEGNMPLVSARKVNNGIKGFIGNPSKVIKGGNVITLNNDGDGGAGLAYYQAIDFALDTHVTALHPRKKITPEALLYMTASISKQHTIFGHGRSISLPRAERLQDMLPVTNSGRPDYTYMSEYVRERRKVLLSKYRFYVTRRMVELGNYVEIPKLSDKRWSDFRIGDLFHVMRPNARNKNDYEPGDIPFVASGTSNNGVMKYCRPLEGEVLDASNCITVSPVDGSAFYQPVDFLGRGGAGSSILLLYADGMNLYMGIFIARMISQTCSKYIYGHMGNSKSIKRERLMLPVTDNSKPDCNYMEQYSKNIMLKKYKQYLTFLDKEEKEIIT